MNEEKIRIEVHKKMYEDLVLWIMHQYEKEIILLLPSSGIAIKEWYSRAIENMIQGASVHIEIKDWFDSETINFLCDVLGAKQYYVKAYPACRMHIILKVPITSHTKLEMQCTGKWKPNYRVDEQKNG